MKQEIKNVTAKIKKNNENFEILVDLDKAIAFKKTGQGSIENIVLTPKIFKDLKKGIHASESDMNDAFSTIDMLKIAEIIITKGELQLPTEFKAKARDEKRKQVITWLAQNCLDPRTGAPHTAARLEAALEEVGMKIDENKPAEEQALDAMKLIQKLMPIKIEKKKFMIKVPAQFTGQAYGIVKDFMLKEEWLGDGSLQCTLEMPAGSMMTFFDKLNSLTHGSAFTKELQ